jgi:DNA-binding transcriptional MerR regulator
LNKAPDAFRTISEVAEELDLPQHVLRFWESRFPNIKPLKRGGGRRYYRPEDVDLLRGIRRLLYSDGYTIKGVQRILREQGVRTVQSVGQGLDVASLTGLPPNSPLEDDAPDGENGHNGALAAVDVLVPPKDGCPRDDGEDESGVPQVLAIAQSGPPPKSRPIAEAGGVAVAQVAKVEATKELVPVVAASGGVAPVAAVAVAVNPIAAPSLPHLAAPGLAARDLDRLKQALAELEACRRLLDKAMDRDGKLKDLPHVGRAGRPMSQKEEIS